jgi:hypothetical protein
MGKVIEEIGEDERGRRCEESSVLERGKGDEKGGQDP